MQLFCVKPEIHFFDTLAEFVTAFDVGKDDLIFTEKVIFDGYLAPLELSAHILIRDDYETGEPTEEAIDRMLLDLQKLDYCRLIAIGGGSVMDTAKALVLDGAYPFGNLLKRTTSNTASHTLINIPTTCGTGAEISSGGIYYSRATGLKSSVVGAGVDHAVLIPELIAKLPFRIFFLSSMDALSHAVEGYLYAEEVVNEFGLAIAAGAIRMILDNQAELYLHGQEARQTRLRSFLMASTMGNMALTANGANLVHALAYPVAEKFHLAHGESVYQFLVPVLRCYERICPQAPRFVQLKAMIAESLRKAGFSGEAVFDQLEAMLDQIYHLHTMSEVGMTEADIGPFTDNIVETKQRLLTKAFVAVSADDIRAMYLERLSK